MHLVGCKLRTIAKSGKGPAYRARLCFLYKVSKAGRVLGFRTCSNAALAVLHRRLEDCNAFGFFEDLLIFTLLSVPLKHLFLAVWIFTALFTALTIVGTTRAGRGSPAAPAPVSKEIVLGPARSGSLYGVTISIKDPSQLEGLSSIQVVISDARGEVAEK